MFNANTVAISRMQNFYRGQTIPLESVNLLRAAHTTRSQHVWLEHMISWESGANQFSTFYIILLEDRRGETMHKVMCSQRTESQTRPRLIGRPAGLRKGSVLWVCLCRSLGCRVVYLSSPAGGVCSRPGEAHSTSSGSAASQWEGRAELRAWITRFVAPCRSLVPST